MCADKSVGGVCGKSIFIDTEGTFRVERIALIAKARGFDLHKTVDSIMIEQPANSEEQEQVIDNIDSLLKNKDKTERFKLLVVDSPVTHYRSEYIGRENLPTRHQRLYRFIRRLVTIAHAYNMAVVVTNQMNTAPDSQNIHPHRPIGGAAMSHAITYGVRLSTHQGGHIHYARILDSPYHPQNDTVFYIRDRGVVDD